MARFTMKRDMIAQTDQYRFPADYSTIIGQLRCDVLEARSPNRNYSLDPDPFLNRLAAGLMLVQPRMFMVASIDRGNNAEERQIERD
jgi:hypothetical protein